MKKDIYVLGTGLSHDGSACLLKNGEICVAIEKERITRLKHDGYNDTAAIEYCLETEGISLNDVSVVVQNANFGAFEFGNEYFFGKRPFDANVNVPVVTISHHLAHAYYALGTSPYDETAILVMDGCGSFFDECTDLGEGVLKPGKIPTDLRHLYAEKDSFYLFKDNRLKTVYKDFSPWGLSMKEYPMLPNTTKHSVGGVYCAATAYCFQGDGSDPGKLMGLAPYGKAGVYKENIFELKGGRVLLNYDWMKKFNAPARVAGDFWDNFQYYADIAWWMQRETERAITYVMQSRRKLVDCKNLAYTGGVALNAVANGKLLQTGGFDNYYFTPAAGDNGLAIGCAYYGWLEVLKQQRVKHNGKSAYGKVYTNEEVKAELDRMVLKDDDANRRFVQLFFENIAGFTHKSNMDERTYRIRFVIQDLDIYNLVVQRGEIRLVDHNAGNPDCTLVTDAVTFINGLMDRSYLFSSIKNQQSVLNGDVSYFLQTVDLPELLDFTRKELSKGDKILKKAHFTEEADVIRKTAELLAAGKVIGWFQGGCEFGPRALGHRSILADPRVAGIQKFINHKIKFREDFRPFAPSVLRERVADYFELAGDSPYMILVAQVKEKWRSAIPGVVHVDNSARIQTVTRDMNEKYYQLIKEFGSLTGLPILLNTSFNKRGMPIVETPAQALSYFFECALDCLVIGDFIVWKEEPAAATATAAEAVATAATC